MKLLIVGSDKIYAIENFYVKYLRESGVNVILFPAHSVFIDYHQKSTLNKVFLKLELSTIYSRINLKLKESVSIEEPDIVWVFKGMEIFPETLKWIKSRGIRIVNYNPDNPFLFSGKGSGNSNISKSLPLYDLHFTYSLEIKAKFDAMNTRTQWLPFGYDINEILYSNCEEQEELEGVCFLGNPDKDRVNIIKSLINSGVLVTVFGHNWEKYFNSSSVVIMGPVYGDEQWRVLRRYRVQLNLMRPHNLNSHNMRTFEVPGVGGIMLAIDTPEHRMFFDEGSEAFLFSDAASCVSEANSILKLSKEKALNIRHNARRRSILSRYSYKERANQALSGLYSLVV